MKAPKFEFEIEVHLPGEQSLQDDELEIIHLRDRVLTLTRQAMEARKEAFRDAANFLEANKLGESAEVVRALLRKEGMVG